MFSLPCVFIVNAVAFVLLLEERFKTIATTIISVAALILSFISSGIVSAAASSASNVGAIANIVCVAWLFVASIFSSSNNIAQKIFTALLLITDYYFVTDFVTVLVGSISADSKGIMVKLLANFIYVIFTLVIIALFIKPLRYLYRRMVSPSSIGLCLLQLLAWYVAKGGVNDYLGTEDFGLRFYTTVILYAIIIFASRSAYGAARFKARDFEYTTQNEINQVRADSYNAMVVNVESYKATKKNVTFAMQKLGSLAEQGRNREIVNYVAKFNDNPGSSPLLDFYCENPYVNALVATKAADAASKGIKLESNISIGDSKMKVIELCTLLDDVITWALKDAAKSKAEEKFVRINVIPAKGQLAIESIHSTGEETKQERIDKRTFGSYLQGLFELKDEENSELNNVREIAKKYSGKISISEAGDTTIARIGINY
jgi:hypothetical protein